MAFPFNGFTQEEHETLVHWDYAAGKLILYTTKQGVFDQFLKRLRGVEGIEVRRGERTILVPLAECRKPFMVIRPGKKAKS